MIIRRSVEVDFDAVLAIVNDAARVCRGAIPADRWHEPYMPATELGNEIAAGVVFWVAEQDGSLIGVMGIQDKGDVALVRHACGGSRPHGARPPIRKHPLGALECVAAQC
jgi:hypothetical protein